VVQIRQFVDGLLLLFYERSAARIIKDHRIRDLQMSIADGGDGIVHFAGLPFDRFLRRIEKDIRQSSHRRCDNNRLFIHKFFNDRNNFLQSWNITDGCPAELHGQHNIFFVSLCDRII
jgi:hypothetical protein